MITDKEFSLYVDVIDTPDGFALPMTVIVDRTADSTQIWKLTIKSGVALYVRETNADVNILTR